MPLLDITDDIVPLSAARYAAIDDARWRPAYDLNSRRFMCEGQQHGESLLDYYSNQDVCYVSLRRKQAECTTFSDSRVIGISGIRRDTVIILACPTACIIVCVPSRYGREDDILSLEARVEAVEEAYGYVARLDSLIRECREVDASSFMDPAAIGCVVFGEWDPENRGAVESLVQEIMLEGMARLGISHCDKLQHLETDGDMNARPGLGSIVVLSPGIAYNSMPHIIIDDEIEWALKPADVYVMQSVERDDDQDGDDENEEN